MLQKYKYSSTVYSVFVGSCLLSIVNNAPVNCKAFDAARWRMINLKLCQTAQSLTHKGGDSQRERKKGWSLWGSSMGTFLNYKNCNRLMPAT